jgi:hypothetical protein
MRRKDWWVGLFLVLVLLLLAFRDGNRYLKISIVQGSDLGTEPDDG